MKDRLNHNHRKKYKLLACVDLCSSDCEITYFNTKMVKRKDRKESIDKEFDMTADRKNNDWSMKSDLIKYSQDISSNSQLFRDMLDKEQNKLYFNNDKSEGGKNLLQNYKRKNGNKIIDEDSLSTEDIYGNKNKRTKLDIKEQENKIDESFMYNNDLLQTEFGRNRKNEEGLETEENISMFSSFSYDSNSICSDLSSVMLGNEKSGSEKNTIRASENLIFNDSNLPPEETLEKKKKRKKNRIRHIENGAREFDIKDFQVLLPFEVQPLHTYFSRASKPKIEELEQVRKAGIEIKSGPFTAAEDQIIKDNWTRFCEEHDIVIDPFYFFRFPKEMKSEERIKFLQYLGHGLKNRLLHLIHKRFVKVFKNPWQKKGKFTSQEDKVILEYTATTSSKTPIKDLTEILNRDSTSIERRYRCLKQSRNAIKWDIHLVDEFVNSMLKICKLEDVNALESFKFKTKHWYKLSEKMNIPTTKLQKAWQMNIHPKLFAPDDTDTMDMKISIINRLYNSNENDWRNINWKEIAQNYPGFTPLKTYMLFRQAVESHVPKEIQKNLRETLRMMKSKMYKSRKFEKYKYKDGHIQYAK